MTALYCLFLIATALGLVGGRVLKVLHFQRDNYRLKLPSPRSHSVLLFRASMRGVMLACALV